MQFSAILIAALASGALALPGGYGEKTPVYDGKATSCTEEQAKQTYPPSKDTYAVPPPKQTYHAPSKETYPAASPIHGDDYPETKSVHYPGQPRPTYPWGHSVSHHAPSKPTSGPVYPGDDKPVDDGEGDDYYDPESPEDHPDDKGDDGDDVDDGNEGDDGDDVDDSDDGDDGDDGDDSDDGDDGDDGDVPDEDDPIADPVSNEDDSTGQGTQCGNGNAVSCCNSANSAGLLGNVLGGSCSIQIPVLAGALGNGCNAGNTFCCPTNQDGAINIALPCIPINL